MVVEPDAGLAQHAQERLLGAELRVVVAADIGHPARRLAQPTRLAGFGGKQRVGPGQQRRRQRRVAAQAHGEVGAGGQQRVLGADRLGHALHEPALAQTARAEHNATHARRTQHAPQRRQGQHLLAEVLRTPGVVLMGVTNAVLTAIQTGTLVFLFPLYLFKRAGVSPETVGFLVSLSVFGRLVALWLGGSLSDRWGRLRVLTPGLLIYAALLGSMSFLIDPTLLGVWSFMVGAAAGLVAAVPTALMSDQVSRPLQGVAIGWLRTMTDSGQIIGPLVMGFLADLIDLSAPFLVGALLLTATAWQCHHQASTISAATVKGRDR